MGLAIAARKGGDCQSRVHVYLCQLSTRAGDVRGDPEVLAKGRHGEGRGSRACVFLQAPVWRDLEVRRRARGVAQSSLSLFDNEDRTQLGRIGSCWPVGEGRLNSRAHALVGASLTRPSRTFPCTTRATSTPAHSSNAPLPATAGSSIPSAHARAGDQDQPEGPVTSGPTHHPPGTCSCNLELEQLNPLQRFDWRLTMLCRQPPPPVHRRI